VSLGSTWSTGGISRRANIDTAFFGHPMGLLLISFVTAWERFSFWGMVNLLVLFLPASVADGGFGWAEPDAVKFVGVYTFWFYFSVAVGGWIADRWIGRPPAFILGASLLVSGHLLLAVPHYIPAAMDLLFGVPVSQALYESVPQLGRWSPGLDGAALPPAVSPEAVVIANRLITLTFYLALTLIAVGGGMLVVVGTALVGDHYPAGDARIGSGFIICCSM